MKAAIYTSKGAAKQVLEVVDRQDPEPVGNEVRVKVVFSGINPSDVKTRARAGMDFAEVSPHSDGAGIVDAIGPQAPRELLDRRVWIYNGQWQRPHGTAAGFVCLPADQVVPLPDAVSLEVGASVGIPLMTAYHAVQACGRAVRALPLAVVDPHPPVEQFPGRLRADGIDDSGAVAVGNDFREVHAGPRSGLDV